MITTPFRLKHAYDNKLVEFDNLKHMVLDALDLMISTELEPAVYSIMEVISKIKTGKRQTSMFSSKSSFGLDCLVYKFLQQPIFLEMNNLPVQPAVTQNIVKVTKLKKYEKLLEILNEADPASKLEVFLLIY